MRQLWLLLLVVCAGLQGQASAQTFNERYDLFGEGKSEFGLGVELMDSNKVLVLANRDYELDSLFYSSGVSSLVLDSNFNVLHEFRLHIPERANYIGWGNSGGPVDDGGYIIGGSTYAAGDTNRAALYWLDENGMVANFVELELPGRSWIGRQVKQTPDGGYVLCGETSTVGVVDAFLVKTDPTGEVQWVRTYGSSNFREGFATVEVLDNGDYWLGGGKQITLSNYDPWVVHTDAVGNVIWQNTYGTLESDPTNAHLSLGANGVGLIATSWNAGINDLSRIALLALDQDGSVQWQRVYGPSRNTALFVVQEVQPQEDLIACGFAYVGSQLSGILLRTTAMGDSLWLREYAYYDDQVMNGKGAFYDVQPTHDGGFIAVGVALSVAGNYGQDVWVVKTDSMGCIVPGCHLITGVGTQITNLKDVLRVWPNPAASGGSIQLEINLPEGFIAQGALRLTVVNSLGQVVHEQPIAPPAGQVSLSFAGRWGSAGLYHLHLSDATRWIGGTELVVE